MTTNIEEIIENRLKAQEEFVSENFAGLVEFYHECFFKTEQEFIHKPSLRIVKEDDDEVFSW